jgi:hypothetical protein
MKTIPWTANPSWDEILREADPEGALLMRDGQPLALIMPFDEDDLEWYARERDPAFLDSIARARSQVEHWDTVSHEDLKRGACEKRFGSTP